VKNIKPNTRRIYIFPPKRNKKSNKKVRYKIYILNPNTLLKKQFISLVAYRQTNIVLT